MQEQTGITPAALLSRPTREASTLKYAGMFSQLSAARQAGMGGPSPIGMMDILAYLVLIGEYDVSERLKSVRLVQSMDDVYFEYVNKRRESDAKAKK